MVLFLFMMAYRVAWGVLLPVILIYLWRRGRKEPDYVRNLGERFGVYHRPFPRNAIWLHAVSLGEQRSATALIRLILDRGDTVIVTNFTPTGRAEAMRSFAREIASGQMAVVWVPFDMGWTYRRFFRAARPKIGLTLEVEVWPAMIAAAKRAGVPLYMCNGQYGSQPLARDSRGLRIRQRVMRGLTGVLVKSRLQAERFASIGITDITVTGELRFDQPIPPRHVTMGENLRTVLLKHAPEVIAIASGVEDEEDLYSALIHDVRNAALARGDRPPLFVYVPRAPNRFDQVYDDLVSAGHSVARRSVVMDSDLNIIIGNFIGGTDVILGDSLGEMYFYLSLADRVIVGAGFIPKGAHNIIEPLALGKPVVTGPHVWTIEYPFVEAEAAGIARSVPDKDALAAYLDAPLPDQSEAIAAFLAEHSGASQQTLDRVDQIIADWPKK